MPVSRVVTAGMIRYEIGFVPNPRYRGGRAALFSEELSARIRRRNVPASRVVRFDGHHARIEEINADYGVLSNSVELRTAGRDMAIRCKELTNFPFCVEYQIGIPPGGPPPHLAPTDEMATIAGLRCRRGEYIGNRHLFVWYTEEVTVDDVKAAAAKIIDLRRSATALLLPAPGANIGAAQPEQPAFSNSTQN